MNSNMDTYMNSISYRHKKTLNFNKLGFMYMAERQGFEPWVGINRRRFSRPVHSTTLPPLQVQAPNKYQQVNG